VYRALVMSTFWEKLKLMKPILLIACLCCLFSIAGFAQQEFDTYLSSGLNAFYDPGIHSFEQETYAGAWRRTETRDQLVHLSPTFGLRKIKSNQWFSGYSLLGVGVVVEDQLATATQAALNVSEPTMGWRQLHVWVCGRIELGKYFTRRPDPKVRFGLSGSLDPYYVFYQRRPKTSVSFPSQTQRLGVDLRLIPQLEVRLKERAYLYVALPVTAMAIQVERFQIEDPTLPPNQRNNASFDLEGVPLEAQANLGVRFRLNP
jgi:hypothetical protein